MQTSVDQQNRHDPTSETAQSTLAWVLLHWCHLIYLLSSSASLLQMHCPSWTDDFWTSLLPTCVSVGVFVQFFVQNVIYLCLSFALLHEVTSGSDVSHVMLSETAESSFDQWSPAQISSVVWGQQSWLLKLNDMKACPVVCVCVCCTESY